VDFPCDALASRCEVFRSTSGRGNPWTSRAMAGRAAGVRSTRLARGTEASPPQASGPGRKHPPRLSFTDGVGAGWCSGGPAARTATTVRVTRPQASARSSPGARSDGSPRLNCRGRNVAFRRSEGEAFRATAGAASGGVVNWLRLPPTAHSSLTTHRMPSNCWALGRSRVRKGDGRKACGAGPVMIRMWTGPNLPTARGGGRKLRRIHRLRRARFSTAAQPWPH
jgi:hypothetical protein